jgi:hypothetical protein
LPRDGIFVFSVPYLKKPGRNPSHKHFYYSKNKLIPYLKGFKYEFYYYKDTTIYIELGVLKSPQEEIWSRKHCNDG